MKKLCFFFLYIFLVSKSYGQVTYTVNKISYQAESFNTGTLVSLNTDDIFSDVIPLPFTFNFFGTNYNHIVVSSNGLIKFDTSFTNQQSPWNTFNVTIPDTGNNFLHNSILAPYTDLLSNQVVGQVFYNVVGIAPYRKMTISFLSFPMFSCTSMLYTSQIILNETTWDININMYSKPLCSTWNSGNSILGIQNEDGSVAYSPIGRNGNSQWSVFQESWRFRPSNGGPQNVSKLKGRVYFDKNNNCIFDGVDSPVYNTIIRDLNNSNIAAFTDINGEYEMSLPIGNYTFAKDFSYGFEHTCPVLNEHQISITTANQVISNIDFAGKLNMCVNIKAELDSAILLNCVNNLLSIKYINKGYNIPDSTFLRLTVLKNSLLSDFRINGNSLQSDKLNDSTYLISLLNVVPGYLIDLTFNDSISCENYPENITKNYSLFMYSNLNDCDSSDNYFTRNLQIENAFKFSNLQVKREYYNPTFKVHEFVSQNEWVTFRANILNPYSDTAKNVSIDIPIDTSKLDYFSYKIESSSHPVDVIYLDDHLVTTFKDIYLQNFNAQTNNSCFVEFKFKTRSPIALNQNFQTQAFITMANQKLRKTNTVNLITEPSSGYWFFPNPIEDKAEIYFPEVLNEALVSFYDLTGRKVYSEFLNDHKLIFLKPENMASGLYIFHIVEDNKIIYHNKVIVK
jgi:hypothetical protein